MLEITRYEGRKRIRGSLVFSVGITLLVALYVWMFPTLTANVDLDEYVEAWPPALREAFGVETLGTIEGFLATELYAFVWIILLGLYMAYAAASLIASDVDRHRIDILLSLPIRRRRLVAAKFAALLVPVLLINAVTVVAVFASVALIGESINPIDLLVVHLFSIPYLLATGGIGLLCSVSVDRAGIAQRVAIAVVFGLFLVDSVVSGTDLAWVGAVSPTRYYDPTAILVSAEYDVLGGVILTVAVLGLLLISAALFSLRDL